MLEARRQTARVRFETEIGDGEVDVFEGRIVDAYINDVVGRGALFSLLGAAEGHFEIQHERIEPRPELATSVAQLLAERTKRAAEWRSLCERAPALTSSPTLTPAGQAMLGGKDLDNKDRAVLALVDGRRTITEVIGESQLDAVAALGSITAAMQRGWVRDAAPWAQKAVNASSAAPLPGPLAPVTAVVGISPGTSPSLSGVSLRKRTSIGIGIADPSRLRPGETTGVVPAGTSAQVAPVPVAPRRRTQRHSNPDGVPSKSLPPDASKPVETPPQPGAASADSVNRGRKYVGRYELICRIGYGGMGSVYLCRLSSEGGFKRLFALKVLRSDLTQESGAAANFLQEARLAGHLHHPHVVSVIDAGLHGSQPYLVMDYIEGASLKQLLTAEAAVRPPQMILPVVLDALAGLHAAHVLVGDDGAALNLVHCDVSPENMLVGIDGICRLSDFGVARHGPRVRGRGEVAQGKPGYLAPEQILRGRVDRRADVFAMGVVLYNALTATRLFDAPTVEETLRLVCSAPIPPPSSVGLRPPPSFDFPIMKALERDPTRRFGSAEEMMELLRHIALREEMLASSAQVASWVKRLVGAELAQRRLVVLDLSRRGGGETMPPPPVGPRASMSSVPAAPVEGGGFQPVQPISSHPPNTDQGLSQTIILNLGPKRHWPIIVAGAIATAAVLVTLLWPGLVSKLFRIKTEGAVEHELNLDRNPVVAPLSSKEH